MEKKIKIISGQFDKRGLRIGIVASKFNDFIVDKHIQPAVAQHGGVVKLEDFDMETGDALMLLSGACSGCASSSITLKLGVENMLKHYIPEVEKVTGMDDPNSTVDPYYV